MIALSDAQGIDTFARAKPNIRGVLLASVALAALVTPSALVGFATRAAAQDATWLATPPSNNYNSGANWSAGAVPTGTASFNASSQTNLQFNAPTAVGAWVFNPGASNYAFTTVFFPTNPVLSFVGAGIVIDGGSATITSETQVQFFNNSSAGTATINANSDLIFSNNSTAGGAIINKGGAGGVLDFNDNSTAGVATITNNRVIRFFDNSSAGSAGIVNNATAAIAFGGTSTAGGATITNHGALQFGDNSTAGNSLIFNSGFVTFFPGATGGTARYVGQPGGQLDLSFLGLGATTLGLIDGAGIIFLGASNLSVGATGASTVFSGVIADGGGNPGVQGSLTKTGVGTLELSGVNTYTGATTVNDGRLLVTGSIASSALTTVNGGDLVGTGVVGSTRINSGTFAPGFRGPGDSLGTMTVQGNLVFDPGGRYFVTVSPATSASANVAGAASLDGTVTASFLRGVYSPGVYRILSAAGGFGGTQFARLVTGNAPPNFNVGLSYVFDDVFLFLTPALGQSTSLPLKHQNVAGAVNRAVISSGALPANFLPIYQLTGVELVDALDRLSGEAATAAQFGAFQLGNQFFSLMLDPLVYGRGAAAGLAPNGAMRLAAEETQPPEIALAYAKILKAPPAPAATIIAGPLWNVWAGGYGGENRTQGDPVNVGSQHVTARTAGYGAGIDYSFRPGTTVGLALAGGSTNWGLANGLGGGNSDAFQAGLYGITRNGPAYLAGAASFTEHWFATDRFAYAGDHLTARFNAQSYGGRIEGGWRFPTFLGGVAPYAAVQAQSFHTPAYNELDATLGGFGLNYNARNASDTRSELGARFDQALLIASTAVLAVNARAAWAHDWVTTPSLTPVFQTLPGASFIVTGVAPVPNSALVSAGGELRLLNGWSIAGRFDGEFANRAQTYAGTGTIRYTF